MSAGHHYSSTLALEQEVKRLLLDPKIISFMNRQATVRITPMPLTGGSSRDGRIYYLDPDIEKRDRELVLLHEKVEKALREVLGFNYLRAHALATAAEKLAAGKGWSAYKVRIRGVVHKDEQERVKPPSNYDWVPAKESGLLHLFKR